MAKKHRARLFRLGRHQAVRIPHGFELPGREVIIHKEEDHLIIKLIAHSRHVSVRSVMGTFFASLVQFLV